MTLINWCEKQDTYTHLTDNPSSQNYTKIYALILLFEKREREKKKETIGIWKGSTDSY